MYVLNGRTEAIPALLIRKVTRRTSAKVKTRDLHQSPMLDLLRVPPTIRRRILSHHPLTTAVRGLTNSTTRQDALETNLETSASGPSSTGSLLTLTSATLNSYHVSTIPEPAQLKQAATLFSRVPPTLLFSAPRFLHLPQSHFPEVAFLGRSNVGKAAF